MDPRSADRQSAVDFGVIPLAGCPMATAALEGAGDGW